MATAVPTQTQQQPLEAAQTQTKPPSPSLQALQALAPMLDAKGELQLSNLQLGERLQQFIEFRESSNCNLPLWDSAILSQFPAGTTLVPIPIVPSKEDAWYGKDAANMKLKEGHVEPKADFILRLGNIAGVILEKFTEGLNEDTKLWACRYNAQLQLPNGEWLSIQDEGKDVEAFNNDGSKKAHVVESTRKKAKRNVVKNLLGIPTSMPEAEFYRPWIILKPIFRQGVSAETDQIIAERKQLTSAAAGALYGGPQTIDVQAEPHADADGQLTVEGAKHLINNTNNLTDLEQVRVALGEVHGTSAQLKELGNLLNSKMAELSPAGAGEGEVRY